VLCIDFMFMAFLFMFGLEFLCVCRWVSSWCQYWCAWQPSQNEKNHIDSHFKFVIGIQYMMYYKMINFGRFCVMHRFYVYGFPFYVWTWILMCLQVSFILVPILVCMTTITKWKKSYWFTFQICYWDSIYDIWQDDKFTPFILLVEHKIVIDT